MLNLRAAGLFPNTFPASGLHLLDASMFWSASGGVQRVLTAKHQRLGALGWRHTILAPGAEGDACIDSGGLLLPGAGGYRFPWRRGFAARLIEQAQPDIVEAADPYRLAWAALDAGERLMVPTVAFCHSNLPALAARLVGGRGALATRRGRWAARRARRYLVGLYAHFDLVMAPSRRLAQALRHWGVPRVVYQPLGVDTAVFSPTARDPAWRQRVERLLTLPPGTRLLLYTGRFAAEKNLPVLADALRWLGPGHALLAVGSGPQPPAGPNVFVLPPERDPARLARLVASCDLYVHAGDQETFGLGVLEAMACGTPVVVSAAGGLGELAQGAGITVERLQVAAWAEAIAAGLSTDHRRTRAAALAIARELDWHWIVEQLSMRYLQLVRQHEGRQRTAAPTTRPPQSAGRVSRSPERRLQPVAGQP